ncbi:MAG: hypothetical protein WAN36_08935, partial [Calditrichia bacterium]
MKPIQVFLIFILVFLPMLLRSNSNFLIIEDGYGDPGLNCEKPVELQLANRDTVAGFQFKLQFNGDSLSLDSVRSQAAYQHLDFFYHQTGVGTYNFIVVSLGGIVIPPGFHSLLSLYFSAIPVNRPQPIAVKLSEVLISDV